MSVRRPFLCRRMLALAAMSLLFAGLAKAQPNRDDNVLYIEQSAPARAAIRPARLACESLAHPIGIETTRPHLSWLLDSALPSARGLRQTAYRILVASSRENLAADQGDLWDTRKVPSTATSHIAYSGLPLQSDTTYYWKVQVWDQDGQSSEWSDSAQWTMGFLRPSDWKAKWIAARPDAVTRPKSAQPGAISLPIFRHEFSLKAGVASALVRISGLGQYELRINGHVVNEGYLSPGWTDYRKRVLYDTFDVTHLLVPGKNTIGILLGNGMYNVPPTPGRYQKFVASQGQPKLIFQLRIAQQDGTALNVVSDSRWRQTAGPITFSSTYGGEDFDARQEPPGWDRPGFDDNRWHAAVEVSGPGGKLIAAMIPAVKVMQVFPSVKRTEPKPGVRVYDLGQNFSGWPRITVHGTPGTVVKLIPGELLDDHGFVSQRSSGAPVWFSYVLRGAAEETWHPRFGYYGFRYVQVEETAPAAATAKTPALVEIEGQFVHSSAARTGEFASSSAQLNRIHALILAAIESNTQSVLTDCPHREKLGWLEESHLLGRGLMYNYDLAPLYGKIADDMGDAQLSNGLVPDIAPEYVQFERGFRDSPEWGSASILATWIAFQHSGDRRILAAHYPMMRRYAQYLERKAKNGIISYGLGDWYDIGPGEPGESKLTGRGLTATAIYYQDLLVLQKVASLLRKPADAEQYSRLVRSIRISFNAKLFTPRLHRYDTGSQTANAMPLAVGLVPDSERPAVLAALVADIRQHNNHVTAGDVGFHYVVTALLEGGRSDVLFDMLSRDDNPSYGYQLKQGATTLTEAWDSNPISSQNHFMLGHIEEWFHRGLAGLNLDLSREMNERIVIQPQVVGDIAWARDRQDSVVGTIVSEWKRDGGKLLLHVTIPVNATATVHVPTNVPNAVKENGQMPAASAHVRKLSDEPSGSVYEVDSGDYNFESDFAVEAASGGRIPESPSAIIRHDASPGND